MRLDFIDRHETLQSLARLGHTPATVARAAGANASHIRNVLRGVKPITPQYARRICDATGLDFDEHFAVIVREGKEDAILRELFGAR